MKSDRRGSWYLLTGVVLGVIMGLVYSWAVSPVKYIDAPPYALRADYKDEYRALVALSFMYSDDLLRAESRLAQLKDDDPLQALAEQAQQAIAEGRPQEEVRALEVLVTALGNKLTSTVAINPSPLLPTSVSAINPHASVPSLLDNTTSPSTTLPAGRATSDFVTQVSPGSSEPASSATSQPGAPFVLQASQLICDATQPVPLIQVEVHDATGQPMPSVEVIVTWESGEDHFFTGLQPEMGLGYGDYIMTPNIVYSIHLADGGQQVNDLTPTECVADEGSHYWGSWHLIFVQP